MTPIDTLIENLALTNLQERQMRSLFDVAFLAGISFRENLPSVKPEDKDFRPLYQAYLSSFGSGIVEMYNEKQL